MIPHSLPQQWNFKNVVVKQHARAVNLISDLQLVSEAQCEKIFISDL